MIDTTSTSNSTNSNTNDNDDSNHDINNVCDVKLSHTEQLTHNHATTSRPGSSSPAGRPQIRTIIKP